MKKEPNLNIKSDLLSRLIGKSKTVSESKFFEPKNLTDTNIPALNIAFSGDVNGGFGDGITTLAGESRTFKSCMAFKSVASYLKKYPEAICLFYDNEFGVTDDYMESLGVDTSRVIHEPHNDLEELKFKMSEQLEQVQKGDKVIIVIDSLGNVASKKEVEDAKDKHAAQDMSRQKQIKSLLRIITPILTTKEIPCFIIGHTYKTMDMYPKTVVSGGSAIIYCSNSVVIITKSKEKDGTAVKGFTFTLTIDKSRYIKEGSKIPLTVMFEDGIDKYSGLLELALESGHIVKPSNGWYALKDTENKVRESETDKLIDVCLSDPTYREFVRNKYKLGKFNV